MKEKVRERNDTGATDESDDDEAYQLRHIARTERRTTHGTRCEATFAAARDVAQHEARHRRVTLLAVALRAALRDLGERAAAAAAAAKASAAAAGGDGQASPEARALRAQAARLRGLFDASGVQLRNIVAFALWIAFERAAAPSAVTTTTTLSATYWSLLPSRDDLQPLMTWQDAELSKGERS